MFLFLLGCTLDYAPDKGFFNSAQANSFEFPIRINGNICKDMDNHIGLCVKQVESNIPLKVELPARPYSYMLVIKCSAGLGFNKKFSVPKGEAFIYSIKDYKEEQYFQCIGEIFPDNRLEVSAKYAYYIKVVDSNYVSREEIHKINKNFIVGKHARYVTVCKRDKCKLRNKATLVKDLREKITSIFSESEQMRFNFWGY
jgi:hypothetical protein